ncbi:MAG TPA: hypothetical protein DDZ91_10005 [Firmicutes bacterium]|nr:hypothetical protein [Bacillota bacterium]
MTASAIDKAGNTGDQANSTVKLDRTAPTITISGVENKTYSNTVTPVFNAFDTLSGLQGCTATLTKNGTPAAFLSNTPISEPGTYVLAVVAADNAGNQTTETVNFSLDSIAMGDIAAEAVTSGSIKISWAAVENATGYHVLEGETTIADVTDISYIHEGLNPNTQYTHKVVPYNALGDGIASQPASVYTLANQPANLIVTGKTSTTLTVAWEANTNPDTVEYAVGIDGTYTEFVANKLTHEFTGLTVGKAYTVSVKARNTDGVETEPISISENTNTAPVINISNPAPETAYSEVEGHNIITIVGTIMDADNDDVTVTATINGISKTATVSQCKTAKEFTIEFSANDIPEGKYSITVTASDGK